MTMPYRNRVTRFAIAAALVGQMGVAVAQTVPAPTTTTAAAATPCLQALQAERANPTPKKKKSNFGKIFGSIAGGVLGAVVGSQVCERDSNGRRDAGCIAKLSIIGGSAGALIGKTLDDKAKQKVAEATYTAAFTGEPASLAFDKSCVFVEQVVPVQCEARDVELAIAGGVAPPSTVLRTIGSPQAAALPAKLQAAPRPARTPVRTLPAHQPNLVMGSVDNGKWLLIGQGSEDTGFAAAGYAEAKGWNGRPDLVVTPASLPAGAETASIKAELPCSTVKVTIRTEGKGGQQDSSDQRLCKMPDGTTVQPDI